MTILISRSGRGELRGIIGPNGAGKSTFFKMLTCEIHPSEGRILFEGRDITGFNVTEVCQLGLTKSYQVNQLFTRLTFARTSRSPLSPTGVARSVSTCCAILAMFVVSRSGSKTRLSLCT